MIIMPERGMKNLGEKFASKDVKAYEDNMGI